MARKTKSKTKYGNDSNGANLGFEATMWAAADKMRNNMDAAEYKHVVLGQAFVECTPVSFGTHPDKYQTDHMRNSFQ